MRGVDGEHGRGPRGLTGRTLSQVLLPLVNVPMLDYSIEFLAGGGVEEIHIIARSHVSKKSHRNSHFQRDSLTLLLRAV